jgi:hypothetical protein
LDTRTKLAWKVSTAAGVDTRTKRAWQGILGVCSLGVPMSPVLRNGHGRVPVTHGLISTERKHTQ